MKVRPKITRARSDSYKYRGLRETSAAIRESLKKRWVTVLGVIAAICTLVSAVVAIETNLRHH